MMATTTEMCDELGISRVRLNDLARKGKIPRGPANGQWDRDAVRLAIERNMDMRNVGPARAAVERESPVRNAPIPCEGESQQEAITRKEIALANLRELEEAEKRGVLIEAEDVRRAWGAHIAAVKNSLLLLPARVAPRLISMSGVQQIQSIIDAEIRQALSELSDSA